MGRRAFPALDSIVNYRRAFLIVGGLSLLAMAGISPAQGTSSVHASSERASAGCKVHVTFLSHGYGAPDDLLIYRGRIIFGDIKAGVVASINGRRKSIMLRNLNVPEGMVSPSKGHLVVVEQGLNRIDNFNLRKHTRSTLLSLANGTGQEGVDGIGLVHGAIIIPDSPYGTILKLQKNKLTRIASGMTRPTDAVSYNGGLAVADEDANAIWAIKNGQRTRLATVPTPDDVTVVDGRLLAVTLSDGSLWEIRPRLRRLTGRFAQPQGLATINSGAVAVADSKQNAVYRVDIPKSCV